MIVVKGFLLKKSTSGSSDATQLKAELKAPHVSWKNIYEIISQSVAVPSRSFYLSVWLGGEGLKCKTKEISSLWACLYSPVCMNNKTNQVWPLVEKVFLPLTQEKLWFRIVLKIYFNYLVNDRELKAFFLLWANGYTQFIYFV